MGEMITIDSCGFTETVDGPDMYGALATLRHQIHLATQIADKEVILLQIPSLMGLGENGVHSKPNASSTISMIECLGLNEHNGLTVESIVHGGASVVRALIKSGDIVRRNPDTLVVIAGAERLSDIPTKSLVNLAGRSVIPEFWYTNGFLTGEIPLTLITAYALAESGSGLHRFRSDRILQQRGFDNHPLSGDICKPEIALAKDGALLLTVSGHSTEEHPVFIAGGSCHPEKPCDWYSIPPSCNMAIPPINFLQDLLKRVDLSLVQNGTISEQLHLELYECFYIAKFLQMAAILGHEEISENSIDAIQSSIDQYNPLSTLQMWASWGISSAQKVAKLYQKIKTGNITDAVIIGNGGIMDSISVAFLTAQQKIARLLLKNPQNFSSIPFQNRIPITTEITDALGLTGKIDMIAFQHPVIRQRDGIVKQQGTTAVRVLLSNGSYCLFNLMLRDDPDSIYRDLTRMVPLGSTVTIVSLREGLASAVYTPDLQT